MVYNDKNNILSVLNDYTMDNSDSVGMEIAENFRRRRIEKNQTREQIAVKAGIAVSNVARFEQKGLISLGNLISLAKALGYLSDIRSLFSQPKFDTMEELTQIRNNSNKKRAYNNEKDRQTDRKVPK